MKQTYPWAFGVATALSIVALPLVPAQAVDNLIVPGQSIGQTHLGKNGSFYLKKLTKPDALDAGMSQTRQVWVSKKNQQTNTLYIHTVSNGALNVQPLSGRTIDSIRVTSPWFHTSNGISTGSTKAQILSHFPNARPIDGSPTLYDDRKQGIVFEFGQKPTAGSPCIAITVHPPGDLHVANKEQVNSLLSNEGTRL